MRVVADARRFEERFPHVILTIGSFDGVHRGHARIISRVVEEARARGGTAALMTLHPHPRVYFAPGNAPNILTCPGKKQQLLAEAGLDVLFVLPFNADVASMPREQFVEEIILARCHAEKLVVGHDFAFGKDALGSYDYLKEVAPQLGLEVEEVPPLIIAGERVSSTLVREAILQGDMAQAARLLGRPYSMLGEVARGRGIGRDLGFPTANIRPNTGAVPAHGVYAAKVRRRDAAHVAAVNIGVAPTIRQTDITIEAYLLDFDQDIVGESIEIEFHRRLRPEKYFSGREELMNAIASDVQAVWRYFNKSA